MRRTVKLTESDLYRIVKRVIREQVDLPTCEFKMLVGNAPGSFSEMKGAYTRITSNGAVEPQYQGYTVHTANGPFCFIPTGGGTPPPQPLPQPLPQPGPPVPQPRPQPGPPPRPRPLD